jgi:hypothetical protein
MTGDGALTALEPFVGEWRLHARFPGLPDAGGEAMVGFDWLPNERFLLQRWTSPVPEAPDGIAVIGADPANDGAYLQHYFDERGVARLYKMTFTGGVWTLWRDEPDFSPLDFHQRFTGTFSPDRNRLTGTWETSHDGTTWEHDFELTYTRVCE